MSFFVFEGLEGRKLLSTLPAGFTETNVASFNTSVSATMAFAPDGRLFVGDTTNGQIRVIKDGKLLSDPALILPVDHVSERGINGIAFDPNFAAPGFSAQKNVYIYYTTAGASPHNRLSRFTISAANADKLDPGSEKILIDDIASTAGNHNGGTIQFGADGLLYLGVGEAGVSSNAQTLSNLNGKVLRIGPDGSIPADNPFVGVAGARPEIWALGLRNPFSGAIKPGTNTFYLNDVGQASWEEIDVIEKGKNYGWPTVEGIASNPDFVNPIYQYAHNGSAAAITGAAFYTGSQFPASYGGKYFFGDYLLKKIWVLDPATKQASLFASNTLSVVNIRVNPVDGSLWYLAVNGNVQKIAFKSQPPPNGTLSAIADAYVRDGSSANSNFGQAGELDAKKSTSGFNRESFLKFDLSNAGAIGSAKLRVFGKLSSTEATNVPIGVFAVSSTTWSENAITFSNKPAAGATALASGTVLDTTGRWYEFDVTAYAKANSGKQVSFDLKSPSSALPIIVFNSDEAASNKPQLVISTSSTGTGLSPTADAYVRDGSSAGSNFGLGNSLVVKKSTGGFNRETYLRFDLSSLSTINSARLRLFGGFESAPSSPVRLAVFAVSNTSWSETGITWNNRPGAGAQLATVTFADGSSATREWDLTSFIKSEEALGHNAVSIVVRALDSSTPAASFASDEAGANRPQLVVS